MNESFRSMMEVKEDLMVSPVGDSEPTIREAHFLRPIAKSIEGSVSEILSSSGLPNFEPNVWPSKINFNGWRYPSKKWIKWVDSLHLRYESLWKKVGIFEAIMSSKCYVKKNQDLAFGVAEKWCPKTNTFVFPWGEATITLEDVMVLGGYPVLGDPVFSPLENQEMKEVEEKLIAARLEPWRSRRGKASTSAFIDLFIDSGSEIEHEAFLATWLSLFVFSRNGYVNNYVFPIAIHLARGKSIALAPAVLASIYKDLGLLKKVFVKLKEKPQLADKLNLEVNLESAFYLVQVWVWERFKNLQPQPKVVKNGDPILSRWDYVKGLKIDSVRMALDSAMEDFRWRPYGRYADKCKVFYPEKETWMIPFESDLDKEMLSFVTCMRVSELVGIDNSIKQYLPHRVAMQFGMDQDVPDIVPRVNVTKSIAWENYCRPVSDRNLYFPSRHFEADVTTRYVRWWKQSVFGNHDFSNNVVRRKRSSRSSNHESHVSKENGISNEADVPAVFAFNFARTVFVEKSCGESSGTRKGNNVPSGFLSKRLKTVHSCHSVRDSLKGNENVGTDVSTSFLPKHDNLTRCVSVENCMPVLKENKNCGMTCNSFKETTDECKCLLSQCSSASTAHDTDVQILPLMKPLAKDKIVRLIGAVEKDFEDADGSKESRVCSDSERLSLSAKKLTDLEQRIGKLNAVITKLKISRFGHSGKKK